MDAIVRSTVYEHYKGENKPRNEVIEWKVVIDNRHAHYDNN